MKKAYADTPAGQVHYVTAGCGEPLLLLHKTPNSLKSYAQMIPFLSKSYQVIAMDTLGFGNSDGIPDEYAGLADFAQNVVDFLDALGIKEAHVLGDHTGACIAVEFAILAPTRIKRLVLSGLPFWTSPEERLKRLQQGVRDYPETVVADGSHLMTMWHRLVSLRIPKSDQENLSSDDLELLTQQLIDRLKAAPRLDACSRFFSAETKRLASVSCNALL